MEKIYIFTAVIFLFSMILSNISLPSIIDLVKTKNLMDNPNERSSHNTKTPTLGGVAIFISVSIMTLLAACFMQNEISVKFIFPILISLIVLLFIGIQDDLLSISPLKKLIGQIIAAIIITSLTDLRITNLEGIFGIYELPFIISHLVTLFSYVLLINSFNLIDGVDGLAGSFAVIVSLIFGIYFLINNSFFMVLISASLTGALLSFLRYNLSHNKKIFMGDTGSMIVGFLLAFQAIVFIDLNNTMTNLRLDNILVITLAILSFPIIDTFRVFVIRILNKKSPFSADRNHIHHKLVDLGFSHIKVTLTIVAYTLYIACLIYNLRFLNTNLLLFALIFMTTIVFYPIYGTNFVPVKIKQNDYTK